MNFFRTMLLLAAMTALFMGVGYLIGGTGGMMIAFLFAIGTNAFAYWNSDKMVLRMHNAEPVTRANAPELLEMVGRLAGQAGLPMPKVYLIREDQPNAFATGRNPENAAVAATTGILRLLDRDELEGVIAHELAHVKNRDILTMSVAATGPPSGPHQLAMPSAVVSASNTIDGRALIRRTSVKLVIVGSSSLRLPCLRHRPRADRDCSTRSVRSGAANPWLPAWAGAGAVPSRCARLSTE